MKREMKLESLGPNVGARKTSRRVGRGNASGAGRTAGKGEKGQKARAGGKVRPGFEGGQMPLYRRIPKFGFRSRKQILGKNQYQTVSLSVLDRFEAGATVDIQALAAVGYKANSGQKAGIKVLGSGELSKKLSVKVHAVTASAREKIEAAGGTVELIGQ
jgi:large subunit ribosomal protein L15